MDRRGEQEKPTKAEVIRQAAPLLIQLVENYRRQQAEKAAS